MGPVDIASIENLIGENQFKEALEKIDLLEDINSAKYLKSLIKYKRKNYNLALEILEPLVHEVNDKVPEFFKIQELLGKIYHISGEYQKSHSAIEVIIKEKNWMEEYHKLIAVEMGNYLFMGDFEATIELGRKALNQVKVLKDFLESIRVLKNIGTAYFQLGNYEEALNNFQQSLKINSEINDISEFAILYNNIGLVKYGQGDLDDALENYLKAFDAFKKIDAKGNVAVVSANIGLVFQSKNQFNKALEYIQQSLRLQEEIGNTYYIGICLTNLARIHMDKGNYDLANQYLSRSIILCEQLKNDYLLAEVYTEFGQLMHRKGDYISSQNFMNPALEFRRKVGDKNMITYTLYIMIKMAVTSDFNRAQKYSKELEEIAREFDNRYIDIRNQLSQALMLRHSTRLKHHSQAQVIYEQLLDTDLLHYDFKLDVIHNLIDLLMQEIAITKEKSLLKELDKYASLLYDFTISQNSSTLLAEYHVLQSKLIFLQGKFSESKKHMMDALKVAEENDLLLLMIQISDELDQLLDNIYELSDNPDTLNSESMDLLQIDTYLAILNNKASTDISRIKEKSKQFFISKRGIIVFSYDFDNDTEFNLMADVIGTLDVLKSSYNQHSHGYEIIKVGTRTILISFINEVVVGYVFEGQSYNAIQKFNSITTILQSSNELQEFLTGESSVLSQQLEREFEEILMNSFDLSGERTTYVLETGVAEVVQPLPELRSYETLLHPIRLIIIKLLNSHYSLLRSDLLKITSLNSGTLQTHLDSLEQKKWISKETGFVDGKPRSILHIEPTGAKNYKEFMNIFKQHILGLEPQSNLDLF